MVQVEDDALLLLKADKTELIDAYNKTEADALFDDKLNISDQIDAYSKADYDALLLLKTNKSELIDSYLKTETDEKLALKLNISDQIDAYSITQVEALFDDKFNIYDQVYAYSKSDDDAMLLLKADKSQLEDYVDLTSIHVIVGQKQFNSDITAASFIKSSANNSVVLLGGGGTKPISEFSNGTAYDSNYVKKTSETSQTIDRSLKKIVFNSFDDIDNTQYMAKYEIQSSFVQKSEATEQNIEGTFRKQTDEESRPEPTDEDSNQFIKSGGTDKQVLLSNGQTKPLSEFAGGCVDDSNYMKKT
ncbi:MAG: hypothetical protein EZS28_028174 [Streblomastix strix]|uniref:Uncharacterized protein n=1 Tax=Streblomastix strix TaxID=222440 RepID=A0A5J4V0S5_9EUKA|nr:MAG: hypothetical protein EZS28_028174 [Streblomastix strix]